MDRYYHSCLTARPFIFNRSLLTAESLKILADIPCAGEMKFMISSLGEMVFGIKPKIKCAARFLGEDRQMIVQYQAGN
jgi:ABC-type microcin C transport system permease subunit YejE